MFKYNFSLFIHKSYQDVAQKQVSIPTEAMEIRSPEYTE